MNEKSTLFAHMNLRDYKDVLAKNNKLTVRITEKTVKNNELICHEIPVEVGKTALTLLSAKEITKTTVL